MNITRITEDSIPGDREAERLQSSRHTGPARVQIQSIIIPLLGDHVLREANHYLCLMGVCGGKLTFCGKDISLFCGTCLRAVVSNG